MLMAHEQYFFIHFLLLGYEYQLFGKKMLVDTELYIDWLRKPFRIKTKTNFVCRHCFYFFDNLFIWFFLS